ncbi:RNA polymerase factor sigma-54 [Reinekea blandensis]|uniref:RNA polymerase sigma-54 factor n=1 Tax=Reinekea blandensis MED297 TaxID=314283 RepID=A4BC78_9GAMM|nr:RNA polymerase factor sigma-54 [Reinekea blandensis]EAR10144.1 RNA polymerase sigma-54 factor RpoN [Reinekea sp. MED297] [Reinekea blandensis MED297]
MKTSLQLKMSQQLTMTPQLQQAIKLLQLSTLDLQTEIQQALESNPMLEVKEDDGADSSTGNDADKQENNSVDTQTDEASQEFTVKDTIPDDLAVDSSWDDIYTHTPTNHAMPAADDDYNLENIYGTTDSLWDHLYWQLNLTPMTDKDRVIAESLIECVNEEGYLSNSVEEIFEGLREDLSTDDDSLDEDEVKAVLHRLQQFDPPGICARNLADCLIIQLRQLPEDTPMRATAIDIVSKYIDLLGSKDYTQLMRKARIKEPELREVMLLIQTLNPRPGNAVESGKSEYVVPDVIVTKDIKNNRWLVELNPDIAPKLRVNSSYASMVKRADNSSDNNYLKDHLQEAKWFIKSLQSRNETLLKVASTIVEHQRGFLDYGDEAMKPLVLHDIAEAVDMHESTISRVTTQKYMHTPRGIYELKYFFSSHVSTDSGGECSSTAIRALIKKLIAAENTRKPLSDSKIANLLGEQGIKVARRTIAKYREAMHIPPSNERKSLI